MTAVEAVHLYTVAQAAEVIGMSSEWLRRQIKAGQLAAVEFGTSRSKQRVRADDLQAFIDARTFGGVL
jgi:excisionase family DNA binding protein